MKKDDVRWLALAFLAVLSLSAFSSAFAQAVPGGTLDPTTIPKYVTPLVIPPEMPKSTTSPAPAADYDIAVRQFKQQILPGGIWGSIFPDPLSGPTGTVGPFPATTVWSYGRMADPAPDSSAIGGAVGVAPAPNSSFNYPAFTVENTAMVTTKVRWINDLVDSSTGNYLPHLFNVDQTLHWANPPKANCKMMPADRTDCETEIATPYAGPVPIVTHVHGAHVQPHSDGYPEAWWLPAASNIPAGYALRGSHFGQADNTNTAPGSAFFSYENTQPAATIWYHDHALGMTRLNVYAGPAGFWLIRGGSNDMTAGLPGPAPSIAGGDPNFNAAVRAAIREVPIAIQDRSFNNDGSLFYPADRTFFDGFTGPYIGGSGSPSGPSDISGIWNPEAFFNTMVVNGTTWPKFEVANGRYRLRLLNGCNSRTLNLSMFVVVSLGADGIAGTADDVLGGEVLFYQIGGDQGFLPKVVKIQTGLYTVLPGDGTIPAPLSAPDPSQALLMMPAERADVIVDFKGIANGTRIRMLNTAPDAPFGGLPDVPADPLTTGQVMDFIVNTALEIPADSNTTSPQNLVLPAEAALGAATNTRQLSLNELMSDQVCVEIDPVAGTIVGTLFSTTPGDPNFLTDCAAATVAPGNVAEPMGPRQARLGVLTTDGLGNVTAVPLKWDDSMTETPSLNSIEMWELYNTTEDAHPIHVHQVGFEVVERQDIDPVTLLPVPGTVTLPNPNELGYKDTVVAFPGQITRIKAKFDIAGLYVWHCHIIEHEDNEMMRPLCVKNLDGSLPRECQPSFGMPEKIGIFGNSGDWYLDTNGNGTWEGAPDDVLDYFGGGLGGAIRVSGDWTGTGSSRIGVYDNGTWYLDLDGNGAWDGTPTDAMMSFGGGLVNAQPVTGDWNGSGQTKIGVHLDGTWYLDMDGNGAWDGTPTDGMMFFGGGLVNAQPVTGDWNGSGKTKIGVYVDGTWYLDMDGNGVWDGTTTDAMMFFGEGLVNAQPVTGDWNGTGISQIGVFADGMWYLDLDGNRVWDNTPTDAMFTFGAGVPGANPVVGRW